MRSKGGLLGITLLLLTLAACSSSNASGGTGGTGGSGAGGAAGSDAASHATVALALSSTGFTDGMSIPSDNTCAGVNVSPELEWTAGPANTQSYALVLTDMTNNFVHWVVWDMPPDTRGLDAGLPADSMLAAPAGAKQVHLAQAGAGNGYFGPCPNGNVHTYQFEIDALDVATLPGVDTSSVSTTVKMQVAMHTIAHADLTGTSNAARSTNGARGP